MRSGRRQVRIDLHKRFARDFHRGLFCAGERLRADSVSSAGHDAEAHAKLCKCARCRGRFVLLRAIGGRGAPRLASMHFRLRSVPVRASVGNPVCWRGSVRRAGAAGCGPSAPGLRSRDAGSFLASPPRRLERPSSPAGIEPRILGVSRRGSTGLPGPCTRPDLRHRIRMRERAHISPAPHLRDRAVISFHEITPAMRKVSPDWRLRSRAPDYRAIITGACSHASLVEHSL